MSKRGTYYLVIDSCFRKLVNRLHELKIIADRNIEKAYEVAHEMLNEWFRQQGEFFRPFIGRLKSDMKRLLCLQ